MGKLEFHLPTFTFNGLQRVEGRFRRISNVRRSSSDLLPHLHAELQELTEAVKSGDRQEIMCEVADILILASEMANAEGFSLRRAVAGKVERNHAKYNPKALRRLQKDWGLSPQEAMDFAKSKWDRSRDHDFI